MWTRSSAERLAAAAVLVEAAVLVRAAVLVGAALGVVAESAEEAAEQAALAHQRLARRRRLGPFMADRLVVVGPGDGVGDLGVGEIRRTSDLRDEADQVPVEQDLGLQGRRALEAPDRLAPAADHDADAVDVDSLVQQ